MIKIDYSYAYIKMLFVLSFILLFLYLVKKYIDRKNLVLPNKQNNIKLLSQKYIDVKNKITVIKYRDKEYLLLVGENTLLIDKIDTFETILQDKQNENINDN